MQIKTENLTYIYSKDSASLQVKALDNITLTINEGEFFGIIGHTGSGKSTFVQHLNGLIKVGKNCGTIAVGDYNLNDKKCNFKELRSKLGMVFQYPEYQLFAETVKDDVAFGLKNFRKDIPENEREILVRQAIELVGLNYDKIKDKSPFELSGGQKRRVAIAGVIVTRPEILVLDEPVAGLDPVGKRDFVALLHRLHDSFVKTIVLVSHDMDLVAENCSRCGVFSHGKLIREGTPGEIFSDYDEIISSGLGIPVTAYLTKVLKDNNIDVYSDLTSDGFAEAVAKVYKGDKL